MFTLNIYRKEHDTLTFSLDDFNINKQATDPSNVDYGRLIARVYDEPDPTNLFYILDMTDIEKVEILRENEIIFTSTNFVVPREIRGYYEMARLQMATEIHFEVMHE